MGLKIGEVRDIIIEMKCIIDNLSSSVQSTDANENENCTGASIQDATSIYSDDPVYSSAHERDRDGVGCE